MSLLDRVLSDAELGDLSALEAGFEQLHPRGRGGKWIKKAVDLVSQHAGGANAGRTMLFNRETGEHRFADGNVKRSEGHPEVAIRIPSRPLDDRGRSSLTRALSDQHKDTTGARPSTPRPAAAPRPAIQNALPRPGGGPSLSVDQMVANYRRMHGRDPSAAQLAKLKKSAKRRGVREASSAAPMSNVKRLPGESLASWGTRLKAGDKALAAKQASKKGRSKGATSAAKTRSGASAAGQAFEKLHPRGRGGVWIVKGGDSGAATSAVQQKVGAKVDGQFGSQTTAAVKRFQRQHGLQVDGQVGAQTIAAMKGQRNAAQVKIGAMSAADRTWLLSLAKRKGGAATSHTRPGHGH